MSQQKKLSLKLNVMEIFKNLFRDILLQDPSKQEQYVVVFDAIALTLISSILKMNDILELGINHIEKLEFQRKVQPKFRAIYFISSNPQSIDHLISDYSDKVQYKRFHLLFTSKLEKSQMKQLGQQKNLFSRILSCKEIYHEFYFQDKNIIHLNQNDHFQLMYNHLNSQEEIQKRKQICEQLSTIIPGIGNFSNISIIYQKENEFQNAVAGELQESLKKFVEMLIQNGKDPIQQDTGECHFLLLDRSMDALTPLLHDIHYQAMIYDLLNIKNDKLEIEHKTKDKEKKEQIKKKLIKLNDMEDEIYDKYRYQHIFVALEKIPMEFKKVVDSSSAVKLKPGQTKNLDLQEMSNIVNSLPLYKELLSKYQTHITLMDQLLQIFEKNNLKIIGELELCLVTGITDSGQQTSSTVKLHEIFDLFRSGTLEENNKMRLILIIYITIELNSVDYQILETFMSEKLKQCIKSLISLGIAPQDPQNTAKTTKRISESIRNYAKKKLNSTNLELIRHTPYIYPVVDQVIRKLSSHRSLSEINLTHVELKDGNFTPKQIEQDRAPEVKSYRNRQNQEEFKFNQLNIDYPEQYKKQTKLVIFMIGGLSHSEIQQLKSLEETVSNDYFFILASSQIISQNEFLENLQTID